MHATERRRAGGRVARTLQLENQRSKKKELVSIAECY